MTDRIAALCLRRILKLYAAFVRWENFGESANVLYIVITTPSWLLQGIIFSAVTSCYEVSFDSTTKAGMTDSTAALCLRIRKLHVAFMRWEIFGESANMLDLVITRLRCRRWGGGCVCNKFGYTASRDSTAIAGMTDRTAALCLRILERYAPFTRWEIFGESANMLYLVITRIRWRRWGGCNCNNFGYAVTCESTPIAEMTERTAALCLRIVELYSAFVNEKILMSLQMCFTLWSRGHWGCPYSPLDYTKKLGGKEVACAA